MSAILTEWPWAAVLERCPAVPVETAAGVVTVRRSGRGDTNIVLLHGIGSGAASWAWQLEDLAAAFRVTAWNAPGYGGSAPPASDWPGADDYAAVLDALLGALDIERCLLVGHSLGALVAARYAADNPDRVAGLLLADPARGHAHLDEAERRRHLEDRIGRFRRLGAVAHAAERGPGLLSDDASPDQVALIRHNMERLDAEGYLRAARLLSAGDIYRDAARIACPSLVVCGAEDRITPPADCHAVAQAFAGDCPFVTIPGAGHASYIEARARFNEIVRDFAEALP